MYLDFRALVHQAPPLFSSRPMDHDPRSPLILSPNRHFIHGDGYGKNPEEFPVQTLWDTLKNQI